MFHEWRLWMIYEHLSYKRGVAGPKTWLEVTISKACKLYCSIAVSLSFTERSSSSKHAQKYHGTTTTRRSPKNGGKQKALALTDYSASYSQKTRGGPQEPSSGCEQIAYRAPGRRSASPARSTMAPMKHAYITISKSHDYAWKSSTIPILKERRRTVGTMSALTVPIHHWHNVLPFIKICPLYRIEGCPHFGG